MKQFLLSYVFAILSTGLMDAIWLSIMMPRFYKDKLAHLLAENASFVPAILFYLIYAFGLVFLIIMPAFESNYDLKKIALNGAIFGLVAYGTYDLTNHATLKMWQTSITTVDMLWGAFLTASVCTFTYVCVRALLGNAS